MTAQEILKLIEEVDPADTAKLDEIDARTYCFVNGGDYERHFRGQFFGLCSKMWGNHNVETSTPLYTRSRDALKAIRPEGWAVQIQSFDYLDNPQKHWNAILGKSICHDGHVDGGSLSPDLPTEELAELHAIIQAIDYERKRNDQS